MVKEKPGSIRTYDEEGFKRRAACLCFRDETLQEVLLISSSKEPDAWIVPGGCIEPLEDPEVAAKREVLEEAGVTGTVSRKLGVVENKEKRTRTWVYVLIVKTTVSDWEDQTFIGRRRHWFSTEDAHATLAIHKPVQSTYIDLLRAPTVPI